MKLTVIGLILSVCLPSYASAELVVDQEFRLPYPSLGWLIDYPSDFAAQTFTVQHTGQITEVAIGVVRDSGAKAVTDDLYLRLIRTDAAGVPIFNDVLATHTINRNDVPHESANAPLVPVDLSLSNVYVAVGDVLAIAISTNHTYMGQYQFGYEQYDWKISGLESPPDPYPGGDFYVYSPSYYGPSPVIHKFIGVPDDGAFKVVIDTPEPAEATLGTIAIVGLALIRVRKNKAVTIIQ
jgi:hypothetical protein